MNIDISKLKYDMRALELRMRSIKRSLREPWAEPMAAVQAEQLDLAAELTALYTLRAWARGRLHRTTPPRDIRDSHAAMGTPLRWDAVAHNRDLAEQAAPRYAVSPTPPTQEATEGTGLTAQLT